MSAVTHEQPPRSFSKKNYTQTVCLVLGAGLFILGLCGFLLPEFMGLHLSTMHSFVLTLAGLVSFWCGGIEDARKAYLVNLWLGIFFAIHAVFGFILGHPGRPAVGYTRMDLMLVKVLPGFIELGLTDHILHLLLAVIFLTGAYSWKRHHLK